MILHGCQDTDESEPQTPGPSADIDKSRTYHNGMLLGHFNSITLNRWIPNIAGVCYAVNGIS